MGTERRGQILERLNAFEAGPTEDERRTAREVEIESAIETEQELRWGRLSAGIAGGIFGRSAEFRQG